MAAAQRIALVTGGNRGIGHEICRQLAAKGMTVVLAARDAAKGEAAAAALRANGLAVEFQHLDVASECSIRAAVDAVMARHGRIDVLVNNAGILLDPRDAALADTPLADYRATLETNLIGPLLLTQAVAPVMSKQRCGRIVNLSSLLGQLDDMGEGTPAYRISKTALNALTRIAAAELRGSGVLVNAMTPGWVRTGMGGPSAPLGPEQGADTAVWLATLPGDGPTGGFFRNRKRIKW
jgi:NAD(P)-dependent dehydrogenase (short-subunit alcohol dehydrogenase family)